MDALSGHPIPQARVAIAPENTFTPATIVVTGEEGQFVFSSLRRGKYSLRAQHHGYLAQAFDEHDGFSTAIAVGPGLESDNLVFRLPPESVISGRVSDEAGEPVGGAQISVYRIGIEGGRQDARLRQAVTTDDQGFYHVGHLPPGNYLLAVLATVWYAQRPEPRPEAVSNSYSNGVMAFGSAQGTYSPEQGWSPLDVAYPLTYYPGVTDAGAAALIALKPGERFVADINLQPVPALQIHLPGAAKIAGESVTSGFVQLHNRLFGEAGLRLPAESHFLPSGDIEVTGIAPGHYQVEISNTGENGKKRSGEVEISGSGEVHLEHETSAVEVSAKVQLDFASATPLSDQLALHNLKTDEVFFSQIGGSGEAEFHEVTPGKYEAYLNGNGRNFIEAVSAAAATVSGRTLEIKGPGPVKINVIVGHGYGDVKGVALRDGKPLAGVMVVLVPADPAPTRMLFRRDQSDSDGTFTLRNVVPGKYTLLALEKGWELEWFKPSVLKPYLSGGEILQVQADGKYEVKVKVQ